MDELEWLTSTDPQAMLDFLRAADKLSERKARLFAVACCRRIWRHLKDKSRRRIVEAVQNEEGCFSLAVG